jgi:hypothetical protein
MTVTEPINQLKAVDSAREPSWLRVRHNRYGTKQYHQYTDEQFDTGAALFIFGDMGIVRHDQWP